MKYVLAILLLGFLRYIFSFAKYNWAKRNRFAAVGSALMGIAAAGLSIFVIFWGRYEI